MGVATSMRGSCRMAGRYPSLRKPFFIAVLERKFGFDCHERSCRLGAAGLATGAGNYRVRPVGKVGAQYRDSEPVTGIGCTDIDGRLRYGLFQHWVPAKLPIR